MQAKDRFSGPRRIARAVRAAAKPGLVFVGLLLTSVLALAQTPAPSAPIIVSDVIIQGNRLVSTETIKNQMKTRPGRPFVPETVQEDVRALYKTGQFGNVWADKKDDGPGRRESGGNASTQLRNAPMPSKSTAARVLPA